MCSSELTQTFFRLFKCRCSDKCGNQFVVQRTNNVHCLTKSNHTNTREGLLPNYIADTIIIIKERALLACVKIAFKVKEWTVWTMSPYRAPVSRSCEKKEHILVHSEINLFLSRHETKHTRENNSWDHLVLPLKHFFNVNFLLFKSYTN